ncbi:MAG: AsmA-like C-terminal region-containing protein [bacterium]|nr:AsmA-like C-terminal region-containing protein [bacterium]
MATRIPISMTRPARRARWYGGAVVLMLLAGLALLGWRWTSPEQVRRRCVDYLERFTSGEVSIAAASFSLFDGIRLEGVRVTEPPSTQQPAVSPLQFFECANVLLMHDPLALIRGRLTVEEVVAVSPVLHLIRSDDTGAYNLSRVLGGRIPAGTTRTKHLPVVRLRHAALIVEREDGGTRREVERINLSLVATPIRESQPAYLITWKRGGTDFAQGRSRFNLERLLLEDLEGGLPWLTLETGMLAVAAQVPEVDHWFRILGVGGQLKAEGYDLSFGTEQREQARLTLRLRDASLSLPIDEQEQDLPLGQRYLRFDDVSGVAELSSTRAGLDFTGSFHGAACRVSVTLEGEIGPQVSVDDLSLTASMSCNNLTLPRVDPGDAEPARRLVRCWRPLRSFYRDFDPHGQVSLDITVAKASGPDQPLRLEHGILTVLEVDASYRTFPYRIRSLEGTVEFTPDGIYLRRLTGEHGGAPIVTTGWLAQSRWYTDADLQFTAKRVALDDDLHDAVNPRYRKLWDTFALEGSADITVDMHRSGATADHHVPYTTTIDAQLINSRACYAGFPFPVEDLSGGVNLSGGRLTVKQLSGSNGAARINVDGHADLTRDGVADLDLRLEAEDLDFDGRITAALPEQARARVDLFAPRGTFDLAGNVTFDPVARRTRYGLSATLTDVEVTYREIPVPVQHVRGCVLLEPERVTIGPLTGRRGATEVTFSGMFTPSGEHAEGHAVVTCANLFADEALLAALPERIGSVCRALNIEGPVNTQTRYEVSGAEDPTPNYTTTIDAAGTSLRPEPFPYELAIQSGTVVVDPWSIALQDVQATHGAAHVDIDGTLVLADRSVEGEFAIAATDLALDEEMRLALPWRWRRTWNKLTPAGTVDLLLERLAYRRPDQASSADWAFDGKLITRDVELDTGVRITGVNGTVTGGGTVTPQGLSAVGDLVLQDLALNDRRVSRVRGRVERSASDGWLAFRELSGEVYGGLASGEVNLRQTEGPPQYDLSVTMQNVDLRSFLGAKPGSGQRYQEVSGRMDAHLGLTGTTGDADTRRGEGKVHVRDARLYRLPLVAAILNVINFTIPSESAFQEMTAEFLVAGRSVEATDILFRGTALALIGTGTILPAAETLALKLVAVTPHRWMELPVVTELLESAAREMLEIDVHGPLGDPIIQARPLRGVEAVFDTLFEQRTPPRGLAPIKPTDH